MSTLPAPLLLVGTAQTLPLLAAQLRLLPELPEPIGAVLIGPGRPAGIHILGLETDLGFILQLHQPESALVCLSTSDRTRISPVLQEHGVRAVAVDSLIDQVRASHCGSAAPVSAPPSHQPADLPHAGPAPLKPALRWDELIGRAPHPIDRAAVARVLTGKRVLITGAGGSIGSELARIAAGFEPELLILMERSENALFEIDRQISQRHPGLPRRAVLHDIVDPDATLRRFAEFRPHAVFHAAAHKHVPLMEQHPSDAVANNFFGTKSVADAARQTAAERFVLISSDKAVNPTSIMGATKRLAELYIQGLHRQASTRGTRHTRFSMVRFGNVLGSAGSVIPIWTAQLGEGGPVTVTDPRMTRYFMTIPEAAALVIQASALEDESGEAPVFVLDMGEPLRIIDLATRFVSAHGYEPRVISAPGMEVQWTRDLALSAERPRMDIVFTGIRPGEKLFEQLAYEAENLKPTPFPGINAWTGETDGIDLPGMVADLSAVRSSADHAAVLRQIRKHVPEMRESVPLRRAG